MHKSKDQKYIEAVKRNIQNYPKCLWPSFKSNGTNLGIRPKDDRFGKVIHLLMKKEWEEGYALLNTINVHTR